MAQSLHLLFKTLDELGSTELKRFRTYLSERTLEGFEPIPRGKLEDSDATEVASKMQQAYGDEGSVKLTLTILRRMNLNNLADKLERDVAESEKTDEAIIREVEEIHKKWMIEKFGEIYECIEEGKNKTLLSKIYTELYITEGESEGVNTQHEVRRTETQSKCQRKNKSKIYCNDIFNCKIVENEKIRTVMTTGIAGIGKTVCVQKFILDWAEGRANQNVDFIFALPFRQLNLIQNKSYTLYKLLCNFHPELDEKIFSPSVARKLKIILIFDGLDESKLTLNIQQSLDIYDPLVAVSVDVLIANLIKGNLLPSALLWITSRPAAVKKIPYRWTEVQGFNVKQKDEYFRKKIENQTEADTVISHIKRSKSLYIMCHIPVFCWILATVLLKMINHNGTNRLPQTLTEVYINFLLIDTNRKNQKFGMGFERDDRKCLESNREVILKLSKLAYKELMKGNILFDENSLKECGINDDDLSLYSGMCSEFFKSELVGDKHKVFCFVHLSIHEFLAAFFVFHSFVNENTEVLKVFTPGKSFFTSVKRHLTRLFWGVPSKNSLACILTIAVDKSMQREDGELDLFLRFLLGISLESNQILLQGLLTHVESSSGSLKETSEYIKRLLSEDTQSTERCMNLLLCLLEMKDSSLHEEIQQYMNSGEKLSPTQCSRLAYMLLVSEEMLDEFDLASYKTTSEGRQRLLIVLRACRKARLVDCDLTDDSCVALASVLQSENVLLKELDLSSNPLGNSGMTAFSIGLQHSNCRLETLRLADCKLADESCGIVATVLQSPNSLLELDLSHNGLRDSGVQLLSKGLASPQCKLQTLRLAGCQLTDKSCGVVASVLQSPNSLIELNLSTNGLGDSGVERLSKGLSSPHCKLQILKLSGCLISQKGCVCLVSTLTSSPSFLNKLVVNKNHLGESGLKLLSATLDNPACKLEMLKTDHAVLVRAQPCLLRYACKLTLDPNTVHRRLSLSEGNRKVTWMREDQPYPDHPDRFDIQSQVLCREGLSGRCYWEAEWSGDNGAHIAVAYKSIKRKGWDDDIIMGCNAKSWSLHCCLHSYSVRHNKKHTEIPVPSTRSRRVGVYLDWPAGTLSFYSISSDTLTHLHTFHSTFTEPLYPGFRVWVDSSVSLCQIT